jgi:hypothetical protein
MPKAACDQAYTTPGYTASPTNLARSPSLPTTVRRPPVAQADQVNRHVADADSRGGPAATIAPTTTLAKKLIPSTSKNRQRAQNFDRRMHAANQSVRL